MWIFKILTVFYSISLKINIGLDNTNSLLITKARKMPDLIIFFRLIKFWAHACNCLLVFSYQNVKLNIWHGPATLKQNSVFKTKQQLYKFRDICFNISCKWITDGVTYSKYIVNITTKKINVHKYKTKLKHTISLYNVVLYKNCVTKNFFKCMIAFKTMLFLYIILLKPLQKMYKSLQLFRRLNTFFK